MSALPIFVVGQKRAGGRPASRGCGGGGGSWFSGKRKRTKKNIKLRTGAKKNTASQVACPASRKRLTVSTNPNQMNGIAARKRTSRNALWLADNAVGGRNPSSGSQELQMFHRRPYAEAIKRSRLCLTASAMRPAK